MNPLMRRPSSKPKLRHSDHIDRGLLVVVNPAASTAHDVSDSLAARAWRDAHAGSDMEPPPVDFEVVYEQSLADGARAVARAIQSFRCALACTTCGFVRDEFGGC